MGISELYITITPFGSLNDKAIYPGTTNPPGFIPNFSWNNKLNVNPKIIATYNSLIPKC